MVCKARPLRFKFVRENQTEFPVRVMCRVLKVAPSGYYAWLGRKAAARRDKYVRVRAVLRAKYQENRRCYGRRRLRICLQKAGMSHSSKTVARLMREEGITVFLRRKFVTTTNSRHSLPVAPNLLARDFCPPKPNRVWVSDITYCWRQGGWSYLACIKDLCTERIVGWAVHRSMDAGLVLDALRMALALQNPPAGLILHSDRGSQYASCEFRLALAAAQMQQSMSRKANCWDNAPAESFFARFKQECLQ
ncbi:MAG: IS3 family transposase [Cytophagaceae bacterium]|nr:MAG: IS3 family transposase [Cytophagaceae bacterium]